MKKKLIYTSFAMGLALISLASCGKKDKSNNNDPKGNTEDLVSPYTVDTSKDYYTIRFYDGDYARDTNGNIEKDINGLNLYKFDSKVVLNVNANVGQELTWLPTPVKEGYTFEGWYVDQGLSTPFYYTEMPQGDLVAYARWTLDQDTIYVSSSGSPDNDGTKKSKAMSLFEASRVYKPGCTIILTEGTYTERYSLVFGARGDANHITKITGAGANDVILDFSLMGEADANVGIKLAGDYHQFANFTVKGAGDNGLLLGSSNNLIENCVFTENHDTGLQISRYSGSTQPYLDQWPSNNLVKNCTSYNNSDDAGEDADGFAAKLTVGYNNVFDGCMAYWNVDDGWDLYAKQDSGSLGLVRIQNCVSFQNGHKLNADKNGLYADFDGDGNGFKLGGTSVPGQVIVDNCVSAWNFAHGFTDNSNPGVIAISNCTAINNGQYGTGGSGTYSKEYDNINLNRDGLVANKNYYDGVLSYYSSSSQNKNTTFKNDEFNGSINNSIFIQAKESYVADGSLSVQSGTGFTTSKQVSKWTDPTNGSAVDDSYPVDFIKTYGTTNYHDTFRNEDGSINLNGVWGVNSSVTNQIKTGANLNASSDTYSHYTFATPAENETTDETTAREVIDSIDLSICNNYVYSDIYLPTSMRGVEIAWSSSDTSTIGISSVTEVTNGTNYCYGVLADRIDNDTTVTLTATISVGGKTYTKDFTVKCQALDPRVGVITDIDNVTQLTTDTAVEVNSYKVYDYTSTRLVLNAGTDYTANTKIEYVSDYLSESDALNATGYTTVTSLGAAGTYKITYTFSISGYPDVVKYRIITLVDPTDTLEVTTASVYLNSIIDDNVSITGDVNYTSGTVYAAAVAKGSAAPSATDIKTGSSATTTIVSTLTSVQLSSRSFTLNLPITVQETAVDVYIVVENSVGLGEIYKVEGVEPTSLISTYDELVTALSNGTKAYKLTADIDCTGKTLTQDGTSTTFKGYFDGAGHTISNLAISVSGEGGGLFYKASNALIKNINLYEVHVNHPDITSDSAQKTAILVGCIEKGGATIENISCVDCSVNAYQRVGGIVGEVKGDNTLATPNTVTISKCSVTSTHHNDLEHYSIQSGYETKNAAGDATYTGGKYVGGILAHVQYSVNINIDSCFVNEEIYIYNQYSGGILGRVDPQSTNCTISVTNCAFGGYLKSTSSYAGGIVGGRSSGTITVKNNVCFGTVSGKTGAGNIVSQNLTTKKTIGTTNIYTINEYTTFENNYYTITDYDPESEYASADAYYEATTLNNEWQGIAVFISDMKSADWWNTNMAKFMESYTYTVDGSSYYFVLK